MNTRFLLITVTDTSASSREHLNTLLGSLAEQSAVIELVLVMRGGGSPPPIRTANLRLHPLDRPQRLSLSHARNDALAYARVEGLLGAVDVVAFPDDDCSYPAGLLARIAALVNPKTDIVVVPYGPGARRIDHRRFPTGPRPLSPSLVMRTVSSNNIFFNARLVTAVGEFDERLGLGARYGAAEDTDYVLRGLRLGAKGAYCSEAFVAHPYKLHRASQYYIGNVAVEAKHALGGGTFVRLARRLVSGPVLALRRMITLHDYMRALSAAARLLRTSARNNAWNRESTRCAR